MDNLTNRTRTRRAVMKKLRELNLVFKAPTKKSFATAAQKFQWSSEQDQQLRTFYEENRHNKRPLKFIMEAVTANSEKKRTRNAVIKRLIELGCIADKSEIVPQRKKRDNKLNDGEEESDGNKSDDSNSDGSNDDSDAEDNDENGRGRGASEESDVDFDEMRNHLNRNQNIKPSSSSSTQKTINHAKAKNATIKSGNNFFFSLFLYDVCFFFILLYAMLFQRHYYAIFVGIFIYILFKSIFL